MNSKILTQLLIIIFLGWFSSVSFAQNNSDNHNHSKSFEIGVANSLVYFGNEDQVNYGLHFHFVKNINHTKFGIGLGYEKIFDEHKHNSLGVILAYSPIPELHLSLSPGFAFEGSEISESMFAIHMESAYDFEYKNLHFGPLLEFAYDIEDYHISLGLHIGLAI